MSLLRSSLTTILIGFTFGSHSFAVESSGKAGRKPGSDACNAALANAESTTSGKREAIFTAVDTCSATLGAEDKALFNFLAAHCGDIATTPGVALRDAVANCNLKGIEYAVSVGATK